MRSSSNLLATTTRGLRVLTTDTDVPVVTETTVTADLLEALETHTDTGIEGVREELGRLAILEVVVVVEEPLGHLELQGVVAHGDDLVDLVGAQLAGTLVDIDVTLLQHEVGETAADTYFSS